MYLKGEGAYVPSGASRKEVRMCHQLYKILGDGTPEQIKTIEGILNAFAPEDKKLKKGAA